MGSVSVGSAVGSVVGSVRPVVGSPIDFRVALNVAKTFASNQRHSNLCQTGGDFSFRLYVYVYIYIYIFFF